MRPTRLKKSRAVAKSLTRHSRRSVRPSAASRQCGTPGSSAFTSSADSGGTPPSHGRHFFSAKRFGSVTGMGHLLAVGDILSTGGRRPLAQAGGGGVRGGKLHKGRCEKNALHL